MEISSKLNKFFSKYKNDIPGKSEFSGALERSELISLFSKYEELYGTTLADNILNIFHFQGLISQDKNNVNIKNVSDDLIYVSPILTVFNSIEEALLAELDQFSRKVGLFSLEDILRLEKLNRFDFLEMNSHRLGLYFAPDDEVKDFLVMHFKDGYGFAFDDVAIVKDLKTSILLEIEKESFYIQVDFSDKLCV